MDGSSLRNLLKRNLRSNYEGCNPKPPLTYSGITKPPLTYSRITKSVIKERIAGKKT